MTSELVGEGRPDPTSRAGSPVLLGFHGFTSTPRELDPLADVASSLGMGVRVPLFPGHGTRLAELERVRFDDYLELGQQSFRTALDASPTGVVLAGLSTGALVALELAAEHPRDVLGVVALANALTLSTPYPAWPLRLLSHARFVRFSVPKPNGPDIADPVARRRHLMYRAQPVQAAAEIQRAGARVRRRLARVRCPLFIAHGSADHVCPPSNAWLLADEVGTNDVEVMMLPRSRHIVTEDFDRETLCRGVARFLGRFAQLGAAQRPVEP